MYTLEYIALQGCIRLSLEEKRSPASRSSDDFPSSKQGRNVLARVFLHFYGFLGSPIPRAGRVEAAPRFHDFKEYYF